MMEVKSYDPVAAFALIKDEQDRVAEAESKRKVAVSAAKTRLMQPIKDAIIALHAHYDIVLKGDYDRSVMATLPEMKSDMVELAFGNHVSRHSVVIYPEGDTQETVQIVVKHNRDYPYKSGPAFKFPRWIDAYEKAIEIYLTGVKEVKEKGV